MFLRAPTRPPRAHRVGMARGTQSERMKPVDMVKLRSRLVRTRKHPPGFIAPCRPLLDDRGPAGPKWIHEIKWDGYRVIARKDDDRVRIWTCTGSNWTARFPTIAAAIAALPVPSVVLDGEVLCQREDRSMDFPREMTAPSWRVRPSGEASVAATVTCPTTPGFHPIPARTRMVLPSGRSS